MRNIIFVVISITSLVLLAEPNWEENFPVPQGGRANPYEVSVEEWQDVRKLGQIHTQVYPISVTGILAPYEPIERALVKGEASPFLDFLRPLIHRITKIDSMSEFTKWIGLHPYPKEDDVGVYQVAYPHGVRPDYDMGLSIVEVSEVKAFTFSCAACHSANLFGKTVLGMSNRFSRANELFVRAKQILPVMPSKVFQKLTFATDQETELIRRIRKNVKRVGALNPIQLGLDTSLAQVSLSLARRNDDETASRSFYREKVPREEKLAKAPADSKPAVWWNLKYKNRWLSDGSVVSGNPILTNILWNELGRGTDLEELEIWINQNPKVIRELTTAVFSSEAPRITDFFSAVSFDLLAAKRGEELFNDNCVKCHGRYIKAWSMKGAELLSKKDQLKTVLVDYKPKKAVIDVGTDPLRWQGMMSLEKLNQLRISKNNGVRIQAQQGYVPPPLVGIWARWPYFHNNSLPSLCSVLSLAKNRPVMYFAGEANDPQKDFDLDCNGYPLGNLTPTEWKKKNYKYDTRREGMSNLGHEKMLMDENGGELYSDQEKRDLIRFLQTL